ncbi:MAG TPA: hypothetical protein PK537_09675, partial [Candidatus Limiplasma sp.]|nr:hypothetical protein [Candidatus Limiplasma sp.]
VPLHRPPERDIQFIDADCENVPTVRVRVHVRSSFSVQSTTGIFSFPSAYHSRWVGESQGLADAKSQIAFTMFVMYNEGSLNCFTI